MDNKHIKKITNPYSQCAPTKIYHTSFFIRNLSSGGAVCAYIQINPNTLYVPNTMLDRRPFLLDNLKNNNIQIRADLSLTSSSDTSNYLDLFLTATNNTNKKGAPPPSDFKGTLEQEIIARSIVEEKRSLELALNNPANVNNVNNKNKVNKVNNENSLTNLTKLKASPTQSNIKTPLKI